MCPAGLVAVAFVLREYAAARVTLGYMSQCSRGRRHGWRGCGVSRHARASQDAYRQR